MNKELLESQWVQAKEYIRSKWDHITDEDIRQINGRYDQLVAKLQQRYGMTREEAEDEIRRFTFDRGAKPQDRSFSRQVREDELRHTDNSSLFKWLLFAGIPLALLAAWFAYESPTMTDRTAPVAPTTQERVLSQTPNDTVIQRDIQTFLSGSNRFSTNMDNIQVESMNGVVTVRGTVPTVEERNAVLQGIQSISGVRSVNNLLQVQQVQ